MQLLITYKVRSYSFLTLHGSIIIMSYLFLQAEILMCLLHKEDMKNRAQLTEYLTRLEDVLKQVLMNDFLRSQLQTEGVVDNYEAAIAKFRNALSQKECPIVVAGCDIGHSSNKTFSWNYN